MLHRFQGLTVFIMVSVTQITSSAFEYLPDANKPQEHTKNGGFQLAHKMA